MLTHHRWQDLPNMPLAEPLHLKDHMQLTEKQLSTKRQIIAHLLAEKKASYQNMMEGQTTELENAEAVTEESDNMFETGKVDQSLNRVEAKASVLDALQRDINLLSNLDEVTATTEIQLGDVIKTDQGNFFVGVAASEFTIDGKKYRGISTNSPLYQALAGKHDGDTVMVNDTSFTLNKSF